MNILDTKCGGAFQCSPDCGSSKKRDEDLDWLLNLEQSTGEGQMPLLYEQSPDGGAFLASQPVPRCGAFCYLAVVTKAQDK